MTLFRISNDAYVRAVISAKAQISFVVGDDLWWTKKVNPCMLVPPAKSCNTCETPMSRVRNWNLTKKAQFKKWQAGRMFFECISRPSLIRIRCQSWEVPKNSNPFNHKVLQKDNFWSRKLTLKLRFWHFLKRHQCYTKHPRIPLIREDGWFC